MDMCLLCVSEKKKKVEWKTGMCLHLRNMILELCQSGDLFSLMVSVSYITLGPNSSCKWSNIYIELAVLFLSWEKNDTAVRKHIHI